MSDATLVDVALPLPVDRTFTYRVDGPPPREGTRVLVSFRGRERVGWVVGRPEAAPPGRVLPVLDVLDREPSAPPDLLALCRWMAAYYVAPLGQALRAALPAVLSDRARDRLTLLREPPEGLPARAARLVGALAERGGRASVDALRREVGGRSVWPEVRALVRDGVVGHEVEPPRPPPVKTRRVVRLIRWLESLEEVETLLGRAPRQREAYEALAASGGSLDLATMTGEHGYARSVVRGLEQRGVAEVVDEEVLRDPFAAEPARPPEAHTPTPEQAGAIARLVGALDARDRRPFLLHGVTGSGKTLVYIELLRAVLDRGMGAIVLVPEIALTPQTVTRFRAHFGDQVAVLHSALSDGERYDAWRRLRAGERRIAVGARSALFAPVARLGAIVVDEEHDGSYKQGESPRYHARDLAVVRAREAGAVCVLGSATPSLETWHNALQGRFERLSLPGRVGGGRLPPVRVVDLREERRRAKTAGPGGGGAQASRSEAGLVLSAELVDAVRSRLARGEQTILLLNRRGYSSFVQCRECGEVERCPNCSVSLTFHRRRRRLTCHHCRFDAPARDRCVRCGSTDLWLRGLGIEQVERVVAETFPGARLARMDVDTTSGKWAHHDILSRVGRGEVDILLGTQMIAKGLDFPRVTLVGVVNADVGLHLPDFRASERTFQLLSQVAGRAGRGTLGGEVLVQTAVPEHYAVRAAVAHDYEAFAARELAERRHPGYPPHARLVNVVVSSPDPEEAAAGCEGAAARVHEWLAGGGGAVELVGPAPCP
ncbi:MAG: primosomal protein N', partial [Gemmatimonadetes bacterium]